MNKSKNLKKLKENYNMNYKEDKIPLLFLPKTIYIIPVFDIIIL